MNTFLKQGLDEYRQHKRRQEQFVKDSRRVLTLLDSGGVAKPDTLTLMLEPLIEIAWVDGRVGRPEQNAILDAAEIYGLLEHDGVALVVMDRMMTRPVAAELERWWAELAKTLHFMPIGHMAAITALMLQQTRFVAALGQKRNFGLWRGYEAGHDETAGLAGMESRFLHINESRDEPVMANGDSPDFLKVLPLVKVAWADGRITKRERKIILDSLFDFGVEPTNENLQQLLVWLELPPDEEFFMASIGKLREGIGSLSADEGAALKYGLISQCTLVAEASGPDPGMPGGNLITHEETETVKHIARLLSSAVQKN